MKISSIFENKRPVLSFEIFPPKKEGEFKNIDHTISELSKLNPDFISITFGAGGSVANNATVQIANKIKHEYNIEPLVHITCLNHSKDEISEVVEQLKAYDLENILALRGDRNPNYEPKHDFEHANELITYLKECGDFSISGACYPESHVDSIDVVDDIEKLKYKVDAGASHLVSQLFFDNQYFYDFREKARIAGISVPIDAGIMPVINKNQIEKMVSMCGVSLPNKFSKVMQKYEFDKEALYDAGIAYAINQIVDLLAHDVDGIHIYTMNNPDVARRIYEAIKNLL